MGRQRKAIRVKVRRARNITDNFTTFHNDMPRGHGEWRILSGHARIILMAGLTCKDGWDEATLEDIEGWLSELGRDRHEAVRRELREHGYLTLRRARETEGPDAGMFVWTLEFHMHALPADQRDVLPEKTAKPRKKKDSMPGIPGHGEDQTVSAGRSMPGISGDGNPGSGSPGPEPSGSHSLYRERTSLEETTTPPLPPAKTSSGSAVEAKPKAEEGEKDSQKPATDLDKAVDWLAEKFPHLVAKHPRFSRELLAEVLSAAEVQKLGTLKQATMVLRDIMAGKHGVITDKSSARRLIHPEFKGWASIPAPSQPVDDQERCKKPAHVGPEKGCIACAADAKVGGGGVEEDPAAVEAFLHAAANSSKARAWQHLSQGAKTESVAA